jgi:hypothetical protein
MNYSIKMGSGAMIYVLSFIRTGSVGDTHRDSQTQRHTDSKVVPYD